MPEKKKKRTGGGLEERIYRHYKALKKPRFEFVVTSKCGWLNDCRATDGYNHSFAYFPHSHGYRKMVGENTDWLILARTHKMPVRQVKDIISRKRGWKPDVREQVVFD